MAFAPTPVIRYTQQNMEDRNRRPKGEPQGAHSLPKKVRDGKPILTTAHRLFSKNIIFETMMRSGEAFGRPLADGVASLHAAVVKKLRQKSFFGFETYEQTEVGKQGERPPVNKFSRFGAAPFRGRLRRPTEKP